MEKDQIEGSWSETVEDLVATGENESAISFLESVVSKLEALNTSESDPELQLASALADLARLYSSKGFSLKADELQSRASVIRQRARQVQSSGDLEVVKDSKEDRVSPTNVASTSNNSNFQVASNHRNIGKPTELLSETSPGNVSSDDDWEAIADRAPDEILSGVLDLKLENTKSQTPKRRGRGTFSYEKHELHSDRLLDKSVIDGDNGETQPSSEGKREIRNSIFGTRHVLVLADFPPSTRTTELEKLFQGFKDIVAIRWVNDTVALAVFRAPSAALEAQKSIHFPFTVRILDEDDTLLSSIKARDLEPPRQRPQTSAQAAQRLIAHSMGLKLSSTTFGSRELRKQEDARRNRILTRQKLRDEAWGDDE
ncbi:hypothetical protein L6164_022171 [Bauhinia variegata]|uniref:Uncharacterized protein n=1 Tax=Bauhinia variegata TaxID=167791 RepID=A0ACB9MG91_BAUVA|nr:hypothetical protein L6164_022171 [Bauhinia variegata]